MSVRKRAGCELQHEVNSVLYDTSGGKSQHWQGFRAPGISTTDDEQVELGKLRRNLKHGGG